MAARLTLQFALEAILSLQTIDGVSLEQPEAARFILQNFNQTETLMAREQFDRTCLNGHHNGI